MKSIATAAEVVIQASASLDDLVKFLWLLPIRLEERPKVVYTTTLRNLSTIVFGVYSDGGVWLRFINPRGRSDINFTLSPEAWRVVRSLPEHKLGHWISLAT